MKNTVFPIQEKIIVFILYKSKNGISRIGVQFSEIKILFLKK